MAVSMGAAVRARGACKASPWALARHANGSHDDEYGQASTRAALDGNRACSTHDAFSVPAAHGPQKMPSPANPKAHRT